MQSAPLHNCLDPQQVPSVIGGTLVDSLISLGSDDTPKPWLATAWIENSNATSFTMSLRQNVTFSDGSPFNAQVVKANMDNMFGLIGKVPYNFDSDFANYTGTTVDTNYKVTITFSKPTIGFLTDMGSIQAGMLSLATLSEPLTTRCNGELVATGPFVLTTNDIDSGKVVEARRAGYDWGPAAGNHTGAAYLQSVTFDVIPNDTTRVGSVSAGAIDGADFVPSQDEAQLNGNGTYLNEYTNPGVANLLIPNASDPVVADKQVRLALSEALNRAQIATEASGPATKPVSSVLAPTSFGYVDLSSSPALQYNPKSAENLLEEDGWVPGPGGIRRKNGQTLSLKLLPCLPTEPTVIAAIQQQARQIGVEMNIVPAPTTTQVVGILRSGSYDFCWTNLHGPGPLPLSTALINPLFHYPSDSNLSSIAAQTRTTANESTEKSLLEQAQQLAINNVDVIMTNLDIEVICFSSKVHGTARFSSDMGAPYFYDSWISK